MATNQTYLDLGMVDPYQLDASSESDGWYTPTWIIDAARMVFGGIDVDPATCAAAQAIVQAETWYTATEDGLAQPWYGRVWCNPPYSDPLPWAARMAQSYAASEIESGMMLVNCSCSPKWAQLLWRESSAVCLLSRRVQFWHPTKTNGSYDRDSALFYFGPERVRFAATFERYGVIR